MEIQMNRQSETSRLAYEQDKERGMTRDDIIRQPHPPRREWVELTDEEIENMADQPLHRPQALHFARAIEAKLKGRNT
jgi:hypothetical protein